MSTVPNNLPQPPSLKQTLGPSFILLGLALGSGELILWPYLAATYGLGLLWGAALGISFQYILNTEAMRYTLAWGESVFVGFSKISRFLPFWFVLSTFIPWSLPGFSSATGEILHSFFPFLPAKILAVGLLLLAGTILSTGSTLYQTVERFQKIIIIIGLPLILLITLSLAGAHDWQAALNGLLAQGEGWKFFPPGVAIASFLSAFAYAGAGGNLNLTQAYYIKEKGFGMGKYMGKISTLFSGGQSEVKLTGQIFDDTPANHALWNKWWSLVNKEHLLVFWGLGLLSIIVLSTLAYTTVFGQVKGHGLDFLFLQAEIIGQQTIPFIRVVFLLVATTMLFSTQVGVLESSSRIISENLLLIFKQKGKNYSPARFFYYALWGQIGLGIITYSIGFREPKLLITTAALLNAAAMMVAFVLIYVLNNKYLHQIIKPRKWRQTILWIAAISFAFLLIRLILG